MLRADKGFASDALMARCEQEGLKYLMPLRLTKKVKEAIERLADRRDWRDASQGWQGIETELKLTGWSARRRIVLMRRQVERRAPGSRVPDQLELVIPTVLGDGVHYEHAALVTSLDARAYPIEGLGQLYRDRADCENAFDELKNQWGHAGSMPPA